MRNRGRRAGLAAWSGLAGLLGVVGVVGAGCTGSQWPINATQDQAPRRPEAAAARPRPAPARPKTAESTEYTGNARPTDMTRPAGAPVVARTQTPAEPKPAPARPSRTPTPTAMDREDLLPSPNDPGRTRVQATVVPEEAAPATPAPRPAPTRPTPAAAPAPVAGEGEEVVEPAARTTIPTRPATLAELRERALEVVVECSRLIDDAETRANAVEAAGLSPKRLESVVVSGLADENTGVRGVAALTVGKHRLYSLWKRTEPLLSDASPYVRASAIFAAARVDRADGRMTPLAEIIFKDESTRLRAHAAWILGELGEPSALPMLRQAVAQPMPRAALSDLNLMRLQFAEAMVKLGDNTQIEAIRAGLYPARPEDLEGAALAVQIIGELRDQRPVDQLLYLSAYKDRTGAMYPPEIRMQIASALAKLGNDRGGFIADEYVADKSGLLRYQAAVVYGDTGRQQHLPKLAVLIDDPVPAVRLAAAAAVLKISKKAGDVDAPVPVGGRRAP